MIFQTPYWKVVLNPEQSYLGRCVVLLERSCPNLSEVTTEEWVDLHTNVIIALEKALTDAFGATMFNWSCLMNNAYQEENPQPHVHFHIRPRYSDSVFFEGQEFIDPDFGYHYNRERKYFVSNELVSIIEDYIQRYLP